jgi:hypothetical protein
MNFQLRACRLRLRRRQRRCCYRCCGQRRRQNRQRIRGGLHHLHTTIAKHRANGFTPTSNKAFHLLTNIHTLPWLGTTSSPLVESGTISKTVPFAT